MESLQLMKSSAECPDVPLTLLKPPLLLAKRPMAARPPAPAAGIADALLLKPPLPRSETEAKCALKSDSFSASGAPSQRMKKEAGSFDINSTSRIGTPATNAGRCWATS